MCTTTEYPLILDQTLLKKAKTIVKSAVEVVYCKGNTPLLYGERAEVKGLLECMSRVFASGDKDLCCVNGVEHEIHLTEELPFKEPYRRVPPGQLEEFKMLSMICWMLEW